MELGSILVSNSNKYLDLFKIRIITNKVQLMASQRLMVDGI